MPRFDIDNKKKKKMQDSIVNDCITHNATVIVVQCGAENTT